MMTARRRRRLIVTGSLVAHAGVLVAFVISGLWKIERLDAAPNDSTNLALTSEPSMEGGSPHPKAAASFVPKPVTVRAMTQPTVVAPAVPTTTGSESNDDGGSGSGTGTHGNGPGDDDDHGTCDTPPCGAEVKPAPPKPQEVAPVTLTPTVIQGLRISGETQIRPSDYDKNAMWQGQVPQTSAAFKVCIDVRGAVASVTRLKSTKYADYDQRIGSAIHDWKYRPYTVGGQAAPACGMVTFVYTLELHPYR